MLTLISPAKKLLNITKPYTGKTTEPILIKQACILAKLMKHKTRKQIADLMNLSPNLALLNYERYQQFTINENNPLQSFPALFLFQGDVYQGLQAQTWNEEEVDYAQSHLRILSGLYGILRPLDRIQPYRLEMGVNLPNGNNKNLYQFWEENLVDTLNQQLAKQNNPVLINLASTEYFKAITKEKIKYPIVTIHFYENRENQVKIIGIYAKKARGLMAKFIMKNSIDTVEGLKDFTDTGYHFHEESSDGSLVFIRKH